MPKRSKPRQPKAPTQQSQPTAASDGGNTAPIPTKTPRFAEPPPTPDPTKFTVKHGSDAKAYKILDSLKGTLQPRPFPVVSGTDEPILRLEEVYGAGKGAQIVREIEAAGQIVFHTVGDTGNVKGPKDEDLVAGNGGHAIRSLTRHGSPASRTPTVLPSLSKGKDQIVFENYDDTEFGYLRVIVDSKQLRLEYHPASDGDAAKTPDDFVTVDLATHKMVHLPAGG